MVFALPALLLLLAARRCLAARHADAVRRPVWSYLAAASATGGVGSAFAVVGTLTSLGFRPALYLGVVASALLLGGLVRLSLFALRGTRPDGLLDALACSTVVIGLAMRAVVVPGLRDGNPVLTAVFAVGLLALVIAATVMAAAPAERDRRVGRSLALAALASTVVDGLVVASLSGQAGPWIVAFGWSAMGWWIGAAARRSRADARHPAAGEVGLGWRWVGGRVLLPFVAAAALPLVGFLRAAQPGSLSHWEHVYFGVLSLVVLALTFGRQAYLMLDNARAVERERTLTRDAQHRNEELEALTGLATTMTRTLDETSIVQESLEVLHLAARASSSALYLTGPDGAPALAASAGAWHSEQPWTRPAEAGGAAAAEFRGDRHITRLLLAARGNDLGVVVLVRPAGDPMTDAGLRLLRLLVDQLGVAVQNARDYREKLEQAIRDPLTGLYNRRFFFEALEKEVRRTERYGSSASLILFDIDDFKGVNDTLGHATGDHVLRQIAAIVEPLLRPSDSVARIGGEEFAVLLPETQQLDALMVADRMRTAISRAAIVEGRRVTVSGGVGTCPIDARSREELLRRADAALYWSKRNGKDICALAGDTLAADGTDTPRAEVARGAHLYGLVASIDGQTRYTRDHSENVAAYASALGRTLGLDGDRMVVLRRAALLHDIGKVAVPVGILSKPGKLTDEEFAEIQRHSWVGGTMLLRAGLTVEAPFVRHHHERFDGNGYPDRIAGEEIPFESRILFVADSFEAMTSDRAYRKGMSPADALAEVQRCSGTQFDPAVVEALAALLQRDELPLAALRD